MTMSYREDADISIPHGRFHVTKKWHPHHLKTLIHNFAVKNRHLAQKYQVKPISTYMAQ